MKIINCNSSFITIDLCDCLVNSVIRADGERLNNGFLIYKNSISQIEPSEKKLSTAEQQEIVKAISEWNSNLNTIFFD